MLPNVAGERATQHQILIYTLILAAVSIAPTLLGFASLAYGIVAGGLGAAFTFYAVRLWMQKESVALKKKPRANCLHFR